MNNTDREHISFSNPDLAVNVVNFTTKKENDHRGLHVHKEIELVRVLSGEAKISIGQQIVPLQAEQLLLINCGVVHKINAAPNTRFVYMQIDIQPYINRFFGRPDLLFYLFLQNNQTAPYRLSEKDGEICRIFSAIETELNAKKEGYRDYVKANVCCVLAYMQRYNLLPRYEKMLPTKAIEGFMPALRYAEQNFKFKISLDEISDVLQMDKFYFCKRFKQIAGAPFTEYVNFLRLHHAEELLLQTSETVSEIAFDSGFSSVQYFNRVFKLHKGCTPKEYQKMTRMP